MKSLKSKFICPDMIFTNFSKYIFLNQFFYNMIIGFSSFFAGALIIGFSPKDLFAKEFLPLAIIFILFATTFFSYLIHYFVTKKISTEIRIWHYCSFNEKERTNLLNKLLKYPVYKAIESFMVFFISELTIIFVFKTKFNIDNKLNLLFFIIAIVFSYAYGIFTINSIEKHCSKLTHILVEQGIKFDQTVEIYKRSSAISFIFYILIPIILCTILAIFGTKSCFIDITFFNGKIGSVKNIETTVSNFSKESSIFRLAILFICNTFIMIKLFKIYILEIENYNSKITNILLSLKEKSLANPEHLPIDLFKELSYSLYLIDKIIMNFNAIMQNNYSINNEIISSSKELRLIAEKTNIQGIELKNNIEQITSNFDSIKKTSKNVNIKINETINLTDNIIKDFEKEEQIIKENYNISQEIFNQNIATIQEVKSFSKKTKSIKDILHLIESISKQSKIIAFNRELKLNTKNGESNSLTNVSNKINDLAVITNNLSKEIKSQINAINNLSQDLIQETELCIQEIENGTEISNKIQEVLERLIHNSKTINKNTKSAKLLIKDRDIQIDEIKTNLGLINSSSEFFNDTSTQLKIAIKDLDSILKTIDQFNYFDNDISIENMLKLNIN